MTSVYEADQYYPTPDDLIAVMMAPHIKKHEWRTDGHNYDFQAYSTKAKHILEPSAGEGAILEWLEKKLKIGHYDHNHDQRLSAIEINEGLRHILTGKCFTVIDFDFLAYDPTSGPPFDLIVMNPPFNAGVKHLLKAWDVLHAGHIVCLLNAETLRNPYTEERETLAEIIKRSNGKVEDVGRPFTNAVNPSDVEVVIVRLHKEAEPLQEDWEALGLESEPEFRTKNLDENALETPDILQMLVNRYQMMRTILESRERDLKRYQFYGAGIVDPHEWGKDDNPNSLRGAFWSYVFRQTKIGSVTTSNFVREFERFASDTRNVAFTVNNIITVLKMFLENQGSIIKKCIDEVFEDLTKYNTDNRAVVEGWKFNDSYQLGSKMVLPYIINKNEYSTYTNYHLNYRCWEKLADIDKAICFVAKRKFENIHSIHAAATQHMQAIDKGYAKFSDPFCSTFFKIRVYKKGTMHLIWDDEDIRAKFNLAAAEGKPWVGDMWQAYNRGKRNQQRPGEPDDTAIVPIGAMSLPTAANGQQAMF